MAAAAAVAWHRRRRDATQEVAVEPVMAPVVETAADRPPLAVDGPVVRADVPSPAPRFLSPAAHASPALTIDLVARRAGVNLVTATADVEVAVHNPGSAAVHEVRIDVLLTSAAARQDAALTDFLAAAIARPVATPFTLAPGETRMVRRLSTLARDAISVLTAAGRPMFVPVVAVNVAYTDSDGQAARHSAAFAIGIERGTGAKLAPFWLDGPGQMHDRLGVRPHAVVQPH